MILLILLQVLGQATAEVVDVGRALAMMQNAGQANGIWGPTAVAARKESPRPMDTLDPQLPASMRSGDSFFLCPTFGHPCLNGR